MTNGDLKAGIEKLLKQWRERARDAAKYGVTLPQKSHREYFGSVNAAFAIDECASELAALLATPDEGADVLGPQFPCKCPCDCGGRYRGDAGLCMVCRVRQSCIELRVGAEPSPEKAKP